MTEPTPEPSEMPLVPTRAISFASNVDAPDAPGDDVVHTEERDMPFDGIISQIYVDVPSGVRSRAGFNIVDDEDGITHFPWDEGSDYAAFDNFNDFWPVTFPMREGDTIQVNYINENWNVDAHLLQVWVIAVGEEALPYTLEELAEREGVPSK